MKTKLSTLLIPERQRTADELAPQWEDSRRDDGPLWLVSFAALVFGSLLVWALLAATAPGPDTRPIPNAKEMGYR